MERLRCRGEGREAEPDVAASRKPVSGVSLLDRQGWADVSDWISYATTDRRDLHLLVRSLPAVVHPTRDQERASDWTEVLANSMTFTLGCDEVQDFRL